MRHVVVVGSGPIGSAFARSLHDRDRNVTITMFEVGKIVNDNLADEKKSA